jgi:hypothetical protein
VMTPEHQLLLDDLNAALAEVEATGEKDQFISRVRDLANPVSKPVGPEDMKHLGTGFLGKK